ncbi:MAG TPA: FtsX-like permease family protein [Acidimicrobiales bacterium]|nr:FtsX-like permease family protein [Acidimicrobiales bacterium]
MLVGVLGGVSMASVAAARRTQSSFSVFFRSTNPSDLTMSIYGVDAASSQYSQSVTDAIKRLPQVTHVGSWVGIDTIPLKADGSPDIRAGVSSVGSLDGLFFDQDRATAVEGRLANPEREDEFETTAVGARLLGLHVGQVVPTGLYSLDLTSQPGFGTAAVPPIRRVDMTLVGIVKLNNEVTEDDVDQLPTSAIYTPALTRAMVAMNAVQGTWYGIQLVHGADVPVVERELVGLRPQNNVANFREASVIEAKAERAIKPEAIALGVFGIIAALAALAISAQAVARQVRANDEDLDVLRAMGARPRTLVADTVAGVAGAIAVGALLAGLISLALSPLSPLGPARRVYPHRGVSFDWTVLAAGTTLLIAALVGLALAMAARSTSRRARSGSAPVGRAVATAAAASGLPATAVTGLRFALEPGRGRTAVPVRSALTGAVLAVILVSATLTFGSALRTLVNRPALYGWNWNLGLTSVNGVPPQAQALLGSDPKVQGWSGYTDVNAQLDGRTTAVLLGDVRPAVAPPILSGRGLHAADEVVVGAATLAALGKHVGDTVTASFGTPADAPFFLPPTALKIVGTATMPAVVGSATFADHTSMGSGAVIPRAVLPPAFQEAATNPDPTQSGPPLMFVRLRSTVSPSAASADMQRIADAGSAAFAADPQAVGDSVSVLGVQPPAEIVNYRSTGATPVVLASGLALGAVVALGLTLQSSVRRRRRDLALLKTFGFTRRQLVATVAWQASVVGIVGVCVGLPLGIAAGRWSWILFARDINAVPQPTVPWSLAFVGLGVLVLVNLVAVVPGRIAARTPASLALRTE